MAGKGRILALNDASLCVQLGAACHRTDSCLIGVCKRLIIFAAGDDEMAKWQHLQSRLMMIQWTDDHYFDACDSGDDVGGLRTNFHCQ